MCGWRNLLLLMIVLICVLQGAFFFLILDSSVLLSQQSVVSRPVHVLLKESVEDTRLLDLTQRMTHTTPQSSTTLGRQGHNGVAVGIRQNHSHSKSSRSKNMRELGDVLRRQFKNSPHCSDEVCSSLLQQASLLCYLQCGQMAQLRAQVSSDDIPKRCKFRDGQGRVPVALVSVPGSGNTWVRGLLEKATGVCTGSIYCDIPLRVKGFIGENVRDGSVLVVKTHTSDYQWKDMPIKKVNQGDSFYSSAILLIRNPYDTFVSERHRSILLEKAESEALQSDRLYGVGKVKHKDGSHIRASNKEVFGNGSNWKKFSHNIGKRWKKTIVEWSTSNHSILVVRYEDLRNDSLSEVTRMLDFLDHDYNRTDLAVKLKSGFTEFQRNRTVNYEYYSSDQKKEINAMIMETINALRAHHLDHLFQIKDYMVANCGL